MLFLHTSTTTVWYPIGGYMNTGLNIFIMKDAWTDTRTFRLRLYKERTLLTTSRVGPTDDVFQDLKTHPMWAFMVNMYRLVRLMEYKVTATLSQVDVSG